MRAIAVWVGYATFAVCAILAIGSLPWFAIESAAGWPARLMTTVSFWGFGSAAMIAGGAATQIERSRRRELEGSHRAARTTVGLTMVDVGLTVALWLVGSFLVSAGIKIMVWLSPGPVLIVAVALARMVVLPVATAPLLFRIWQRHELTQPEAMTPRKRGMRLMSKIGLTVVSCAALSLIVALAVEITLGMHESVALMAMPLSIPLLFLIWGKRPVDDGAQVEYEIGHSGRNRVSPVFSISGSAAEARA